MLQVVVSLLVILYSFPGFAQYYQDGNVPAFLRNEAAQNQPFDQPLNQQQFQPQSFQGGSQPAFLQAEQEQQQQLQIQANQQENTLNYQSADPNSETFTLPPSDVQQNSSDEPAFLQQEKVEKTQDNNNQTPTETNSETSSVSQSNNEDENVIRINFSDDEYKPEEEITEVKEGDKQEENNNQEISEPAELAEGDKISDEDHKQLKEKQESENIEKAAVLAPEKTSRNLIRINYDKNKVALADNDKSALNAVVAMLKADKNKKIRIKSFTSADFFNNDYRRIGLQRVINIRDYLMKQGVNFSQTEVKVYGSEKNKEGLDYIDIDKI
jgi:outer membrane protein OmpA-like peptidoglycan-associated protein